MSTQILQCNRCGASNKAPHGKGCAGRKVRVTVLTMAEDFPIARDSGFSTAPPRNVVRVFDDGEDCGYADRYTVVRLTPIGWRHDGGKWNRRNNGGHFGFYIHMNCNSSPYHPQGIGMTGETEDRPLWNAGQYGGDNRPEGTSPARWRDLPEGVRRAAWDLACNDKSSGTP